MDKFRCKKSSTYPLYWSSSFMVYQSIGTCRNHALFTQKFKNKNFNITILGAIYFGCCSSILSELSSCQNSLYWWFLNHYYFYRNFLFVVFPFFTIGYLLKRIDWKPKLRFQKKNFVLLISGSLLLLESSYNYYHSHEVFDLFISLIVVAPLIFLNFKELKFKTNSNTNNLSLLATAIYLVHPLVYVINNKILHCNKLELIPITILLSYLISLILIKN